MKTITICALLSVCLLTSQANAQESGLYVGLDVFGSGNTFTYEVAGSSTDVDNDSSGFKLKFGAVSNDGWRVQGYWQNETYDRPFYDNKNDVLNEIGVDIIKGFEVTPEFCPFVQIGLGYGWMNVENYNEDTANEVSLKIGGGMMYKFTPAFEGILGIDLQHRAWSDRVVLGIPINISENSSKVYIGANIHF